MTMDRTNALRTAHEILFRRNGMASGGVVMAPVDRLDASRDKLGIQGQGLMTTRSQDSSVNLTTGEPSPNASRPSTATSGDQSEAFGSFSMPAEAVNVLETVINMNKALEQQIDALRMRLTVESKNHDSEKYKIIKEKEKQINKKEEEINDLKDSLVNRDERIGSLVKEGHQKDEHIKEKEQEIIDLKDLVKQTEDYAEQLKKRVEKLRVDKHKLQSDDLYKEQNLEMQKLRHEIVSMKDKVNSMEKELVKAKFVIDQQNTKISGLEAEKGVLSDRFREELDRASRAMRSEVERMREVMKQQYEEMRNLREQNIEISSDVRDIKDILLKGTVRSEMEVMHKDKIDVKNINLTPNYGTRMPLTARGPGPSTTMQKPNATVRSSMPSITTMKQAATTQGRGQAGFPPIAKPEDTTVPHGKWIPAGARQSSINQRSSKGARK
ncbi:putative leucine-rich repeat-containing protein DDB_G0290503 isoform X2 [Dreissena polymorpha]|uniref:putative leucine-rich repeat-containing protein DDB_G0290503 isoform X2 n=1 Tax=Dreissena polymorpha TaxID=45954 RepID=UPI002264F840|nr:putative leucine-rich repeat-containing protein DDB_G0290503 isoform X2 [Dreissena polymorpha]